RCPPGFQLEQINVPAVGYRNTAWRQAEVIFITVHRTRNCSFGDLEIVLKQNHRRLRLHKGGFGYAISARNILESTSATSFRWRLSCAPVPLTTELRFCYHSFFESSVSPFRITSSSARSSLDVEEIWACPAAPRPLLSRRLSPPRFQE